MGREREWNPVYPEHLRRSRAKKPKWKKILTAKTKDLESNLEKLENRIFAKRRQEKMRLARIEARFDMKDAEFPQLNEAPITEHRRRRKEESDMAGFQMRLEDPDNDLFIPSDVSDSSDDEAVMRQRRVEKAEELREKYQLKVDPLGLDTEGDDRRSRKAKKEPEAPKKAKKEPEAPKKAAKADRRASDAAPARDPSAPNPKDDFDFFVPCAAAFGPFPGYTFRAGKGGLGYYRDLSQVGVTPVVPVIPDKLQRVKGAKTPDPTALPSPSADAPKPPPADKAPRAKPAKPQADKSPKAEPAKAPSDAAPTPAAKPAQAAAAKASAPKPAQGPPAKTPAQQPPAASKAATKANKREAAPSDLLKNRKRGFASIMDDSDSDAEEGAQGPARKKHISAYERRQLKKEKAKKQAAPAQARMHPDTAKQQQQKQQKQQQEHTQRVQQAKKQQELFRKKHKRATAPSASKNPKEKGRGKGGGKSRGKGSGKSRGKGK